MHVGRSFHSQTHFSNSTLKGQCVTFVLLWSCFKCLMVHMIIWPKKIMCHIPDITTKHAVMLLGHSGAGNTRYIHVKLHRETKGGSWGRSKALFTNNSNGPWQIISVLELPTYQVTDTFLKCIMMPALWVLLWEANSPSQF